ncbi:MAG TPA: hypothetical protein VN241_01450 [Microbacterium sp.]|nr:hypothetical protein [Microbacterium sp.]
MRTTWNGITIDAVDYELITLGSAAGAKELGSFSDVHISARPVWRIVAGYLMLASDEAGGLGIFSHGRQAASVSLHGDHVVFQTADARRWQPRGDSVRAAGIALASASAPFEAADDGIRIRAIAPWEVSIVHGPAEQKIDARIELLASLRRVGGRRG